MGQYVVRMGMETGIGLGNNGNMHGEGMEMDRNMEGMGGGRNRCRSKV